MWPFRFAMRRKRGLPNMVVYLLSESPKNGVELMDGVESITRGWWRPTPGSIYPLLKEMVDQGLVVRRDSDNRYELSQRGRDQAAGVFGPVHRVPRRPRTVNDMVDQMHSFVSYMEDVKSSNGTSLDPHMGRLRGLAKRIAELTGEDEKRKS